jgi:Aspartyl protease/PDZ domain
MPCHKNTLIANALSNGAGEFYRLFLSLILLFIGCLPAKAQEEFIPSPSRFIASLPFSTFTGGVVVVKAQLDGYADSLNFIIDTGSGGISLDSATCVRLKIPTLASDKTIRGIAGIRNVRFVYNQTLKFNSLQVDSLDFHVNDYELLSSVYGDKIDGIIGYTFFSRYIVKIDYDSSKLLVYSKGYMKYPKGGFLLRPLLVSLPIQLARVEDANDILARFYFDTGAGLCLLFSTDFASDSSLLNRKKSSYLTQAEGLGGKTNMRLTTIKEFKLGPYKFRHVPTYIFDDEYNVTSYPYLGGLIGNDILRRFNIILNYDHRDIYMVPNTHYRDPFDYSYTGLGIYWIDGEVRVGDVMKDSPAERAGFRIDDIILAMNNNFSKNMQVYKNMLQNIGEKIRVIVKRGESLEQLSMRVKSIL